MEKAVRNKIEIERLGYRHILIEVDPDKKDRENPSYMGKSGYALHKVEKIKRNHEI